MRPPSSFSFRPNVDAQNPYLGLHAFHEANTGFFFGRTRETAELARLVRRETITVLYGVSGLGKTSLLNAGLFGRLREENHLPISVRLSFNASHGDLVAQVLAAVARTAREQEVDTEAPLPGETLWSYFHRVPFWDKRNRPLVPVLVFDQFEELFTLGASSSSVDPFLTELADLVENHIPARLRALGDQAVLPPTYDKPKAQVVLSLREDYLPRLDDLRPRIPSLMLSRYRLRRMNGLQALEAVLQPGRAIIEPDVAAEVVRFVAATAKGPSKEDLELLEVEPALLSLVCHELNVRRQGKKLSHITKDLLSGESHLVLDDFYKRSVQDLEPAAQRFLEDRLLTNDGYRTTVALTDALEAPGMSAEVIEKLINRRLLRREERLELPHIELVHDVLTGVLRRSRAQRLEQAESRQRLKRALALGATVVGLAVVGLILVIWRVSAHERQRQLQEQEAREQEIARETAQVLAHEAGRQLAESNPSSANTLLGLAWHYAKDKENRFEPDQALGVMVARATRRLQGQSAVLEHSADILQVRFSGNGQRVVATGKDGVASVWSTEGSASQERKPWRFRPSKYKEEAAPAPEQDGDKAPAPGYVRPQGASPGLEQRPPGRGTPEPAGPEPLVAALDFEGHRLVILGQSSQTATLWDVETVKATAPFKVAARPVRAEFDRTGTRLLVQFDRGGASLFALEQEKPRELSLRRSPGGVQPASGSPKQPELASMVRFSPDGKRIVGISEDNKVRVWSARDGELQAVLEHKKPVHDALFSPDGRWLATACDDGFVRLWEVSNLGAPGLKPAAMLPHNKKPIYQVLFSADSSRLTARTDEFARIWEISSSRVVTDIGGNKPIQYLFMADSQLAVWSEGRRLALWDPEKGLPLYERDLLGGSEQSLPEPAQGIVPQLLDISPHGQHVVLARSQQAQLFSLAPSGTAAERILASGLPAPSAPVALEDLKDMSFDTRAQVSPSGRYVALIKGPSDEPAKLAHLLEVQDGTLHEQKLPPGGVEVERVWFSPGDKRLAIAGKGKDKGLHLWDLTEGKMIFTNSQVPSGWIRELAFSHQSGWFVTGEADGRVCFWDAPSGPRGRCNQISSAPIEALTISDDDLLVAAATGNGQVVLLRSMTRERLQSWKVEKGGFLRIFLTPSRHVMVVAQDGHVYRWQGADGAPLPALEHGSQLQDACLLPGTGRLLTIGTDGIGRLWSSSGELKLELPGIRKSGALCAVKPTGAARPPEELVATLDSRQIRVWSPESGQPILHIDLDTWLQNAMAWSADGRFLVTAEPRSVSVWPVFTRDSSGPRGHAAPVEHAVFSEDGLRLATADAPGGVKIWSLPDGQSVAEQQMGATPSSGFFIGSTFVTGSSQEQNLHSPQAQAGALRVLPQAPILAVERETQGPGVLAIRTGPEWLTGESVQSLRGVIPKYRAHGDKISQLEFTADGRSLITAGRDGNVLVWDTQTYTRTQEFHGDGWPIQDLELSTQQGFHLATFDGHSVALWDETGKRTNIQPPLPSALWRLLLSPKGDRLILIGSDEVRIVDTSSGHELARLPHPKSSDSWIRIARSAERFLLCDLVTQDEASSCGIYSTRDGSLVTRLESKASQSVQDVLLSRDGSLVVTQDGKGALVLWDATTGQRLESREDVPSSSLESLSWDGSQLFAVGRKDDVLRSIGITQRRWGQLRELLPGVQSIASSDISRDGQFAAVTEFGDNSVNMWHLAGKASRVLHQPTRSSFAVVRLNADGSRLAVLTVMDGTVQLYDTRSQKLGLTIGFDRRIATRYTRAGPRVATVDSEKHLTVWDAKTGEPLRGFEVPLGKIQTAEFDPDGSRLLVAEEDGKALVCDLTPEGSCTELSPSLQEVSLAKYAPDGAVLLADSKGNAIYLAKEGNPVKLQGDGTPMSAAAFSASGDLLLTGYQSGAVRLWNRRGDLLDVLLGHSVAVRAANFSPDGMTAVTGDNDGAVRLWDLHPEKRSADEVKRLLGTAQAKSGE